MNFSKTTRIFLNCDDNIQIPRGSRKSSALAPVRVLTWALLSAEDFGLHAAWQTA